MAGYCSIVYILCASFTYHLLTEIGCFHSLLLWTMMRKWKRAGISSVHSISLLVHIQKWDSDLSFSVQLSIMIPLSYVSFWLWIFLYFTVCFSFIHLKNPLQIGTTLNELWHIVNAGFTFCICVFTFFLCSFLLFLFCFYLLLLFSFHHLHIYLL